MATAKSRKKTSMSDEHLQALAKGRTEGAAVRRYLVALENHKPRRGRKRTPESMKRRLNAIEQSLPKVDPLLRVHLLQERIDLEHALEASHETVDLKALEDDFIKAAKTYGERKRISYAAWREAGVDAAILKRAGIRRSGV
jgi:hypothetical protein